MADKPLYYGSSKSTPMYYGGTPKPAYSGKPMYYGSSSQQQQYGSYGSYGGYGSYGSYGAYGGNAGGQGGDEGSLVGTITVGRMLRVISQRWLSVFVFLIIGIIAAFAVYRISPTIYQASSEFTMDMRRWTGHASSAYNAMTPDYGGNYGEIFNTRLPEWRGARIISMIQQQYRTNHPSSTVTDEEILSAIGGSRLELQRFSRLIKITVRSKNPQLAAAVANAYAEAIETFTDEENRARCDKAVQEMHANVENRRREKDRLSKQLLDFRTANKVDSLRLHRESIEKSLGNATSDILGLESQENQLVEWEKLLEAVQQDPNQFGTLSSGIPRAAEIQNEYNAYQQAVQKLSKLTSTLTELHPDVINAKSDAETAKARFLEATSRALQTGRSTLKVVRNRIVTLGAKKEELSSELTSLEQRIVMAESGLSTLETEFKIASDVLKGLILDENKARMDAESNNEIVRLGRLATVPSVPVLPNPMIIFGAGVALSLAVGILFVLVMDNLEDTVVNLSDIEGRLSLKVLAVFPHVRRKKREQVAKFAVEDKYSQFSEAVAGLRNLLDSPRYEAMSHCLLVISTQPGEGKTITSTSIAISYAQAGRRTLHVDFDLRRPRIATIWELELTPDRSFSHVLQKAAKAQPRPDFGKLVNHSSVPGLDVIASLPPDGVSPSQILGSNLVVEFFEWARANYDRVIIDSPPYGVVGDVVSLSVLVDSVIVMCCPDRTHFKPIQYCTRSLTEAGANILGVIVNDVEVSSASAFSPNAHHSYGYSYGYGYGYGSGYGSTSGRRRGDGDNPADGDGRKGESPVEHEEFTDED